MEALNEVKRMSHQSDVLPIIEDLWEGAGEKYPDLDWRFVNTDIIRANLADVLIQADANGEIHTDRAGLRAAVLALVNSKDPNAARSAILTLAWIDESADVAVLTKIAQKNEKSTFRAAALSLARMCNPEAAKALAMLSNDIKDRDARSFILEVQNKQKTIKQSTNWCEITWGRTGV